MKPTFRTDENAKRYYELFKYDLNGVQTSLDEELKERYTVNASVLNGLIGSFDSMRTREKVMNNPKRCLWDIILKNCEKLRYRKDEDRQGEQNPVHTLPHNLNRLKDVIREYRKPVTDDEGNRWPRNYRSLISGKIGNSHTVKITWEVGELLIALKRSRNPVFTDRQIFERFNEVELPAHNEAVEMQTANGQAEVADGVVRVVETGEELHVWKPLKSLRSMVQWLNRPEIVPFWYDAERGDHAARQRFSIRIGTDLASCRDARWEGDGTKLNLYYRGEDGKRHTCTVYEVMDTYSEALLGYRIADTEDYLQQYHAFRMAVQNTRRKPYEIVTDNQGGAKTKKLRDFIKAISHIARTTMPNNPQSKSIEGVLGRFQTQVLHQIWGYTGRNVTAKKESSRPNLEFVEENTDTLPTLEELKTKYAELREMWNGERAMLTTEKILTHHKSGIGRMQMYLESVNEFAPEISAEEMAESFWLWTDRPTTFNSDGIEVEVNKVKYRYSVFAADAVNAIDAEWLRRNLYRKFWVKYDPYDMSQVKLYWEDNAGGRRFERLASPPVKAHRAIQDQQEGEAAYIRSVLKANKQEQIHRFLANKEIEWKHGVAPEQNGLHTPKINGLTGEEMAEVNLMLERRTRKYRNKSLAQEYKDISMMTYDEVRENDLQEEEFNYKKAVGKY